MYYCGQCWTYLSKVLTMSSLSCSTAAIRAVCPAVFTVLISALSCFTSSEQHCNNHCSTSVNVMELSLTLACLPKVAYIRGVLPAVSVVFTSICCAISFTLLLSPAVECHKQQQLVVYRSAITTNSCSV